ncbi:serine protease [Flindersiella endophytica]
MAVLAATAIAALSVAGTTAQASASEPRFDRDKGSYTPQIIGGSPASEAYPFMASLQYKDPNRPSPIRCGATLVSPHWLVTAAHCVANLDGTELDPAPFQVKIGSTDYQAGTTYQIERFVAHPWWGAGQESIADIALIKLTAAASQPFLDNVGSPSNGTPVRILGWGRTVDGDSTSIPRQLQQLDSTTLPYASCIHNDPYDITPGDLCVDAPGGTASICSGDSGGPLLYKSQGVWFFAGVASRSPGESGCLDGPPVFTSTSSYWHWVQVQILNDV